MASCGSQSHLVGALSGSLCNLKVGSLNCRGLCNKVKCTESFDYLKKSADDISKGLSERKFQRFAYILENNDDFNSKLYIILRDMFGLHLFTGSGNRRVYTDS